MIAAVCTGHDYTAPGKPRIDWTDPAAKHALVSALVNDANAVCAVLADTELDEAAAAARGVAGAGGRAGRGTGRGLRWARRAVADRPEGRPGPGDLHRGPAGPAHPQVPEQPPDGYRAHVVAEPETGLITDEALTMAAGPENSDAAVAATVPDPHRTGGHRRRAGSGRAGSGRAGPGRARSPPPRSPPPRSPPLSRRRRGRGRR